MNLMDELRCHWTELDSLKWLEVTFAVNWHYINITELNETEEWTDSEL